MYPVVGEWPLFGGEIRSYQLLRWAFLFVGGILVAYLNRRRGIAPMLSVRVFVLAIPIALAGGHLLNVIEALPFYRNQPVRVLDIVSGGSSIYGALFFGLGFGVWYLWRHGLPVRTFLDGAAPAIVLGEAMTRVGCFLNGCCFGLPSTRPWGVAFPPDSQVFVAQLSLGLVAPGSDRSVPVHPTQLYSVLFSLGLFGVLLYLFAKERFFPGALFCIAVSGYGLQRLIVGQWRADAALYWWELSNALSILIIVLGVVLWIAWRPPTQRLFGER